MSDWKYCGETFDDPGEYQGFVYLIHCHLNDRKYIGKKNFWTTRKLPPLKGQKRKRHRREETDWRTYWGSSNKLLADLETFGEDVFTKQILYLCHNKSEMSYWETKTQIDQRVLFTDEYYNEIVSCRINKSGVKNL